MLVYGDAAERLDTRGELDRLGQLAATPAGPPGLATHMRRADLFFRAAGLAQGLVDAEFAPRGRDGPSPLRDAAADLVGRTAAALAASWQAGSAVAKADLSGPLAQLGRLDLPDAIEVRRPEGYAYYALYPEGHAVAARSLAGRRVSSVIGLRSIGLGLSAMVAAGAGACWPVTVRPGGHPFARTLDLDEAMAPLLLGSGGGAVAVVDEGPGLSGSSLGAVLDWLERRGVTRDRFEVFPGHAGDLGPMASAAHRARWATLRRHVVAFDALVSTPNRPWHVLADWVADLTGEAAGPLEDLSGGAWRQGRPLPANPMQERRKFRLRGGDGTAWLLKFVGLGQHGEAAFRRAGRLADAGLCPPVAGFRHGFMVERWVEDAVPLDPARHDRASLVDHVGRYLGTRARLLPAEPGSGASTSDLQAMARHNVGQALGPEAVRGLERHLALGDRLGGLPRVETDNRMHAWEWLVVPGGRLLKTDAVDHCAAHDLVGCQPIAWDVAGAAVELGFDDTEAEHLRVRTGIQAGGEIPHEAVAFLRVAYLAFWLGACTLGADALGSMPEEAARLRAEAGRYADHLRALL